MSSVARDRIRRCLAMIPLIRARPGIRIPELASIFGVREEEIWEDITEVLTMCGVPPYLPHNYLVFGIQGDRVSIRFAEHLSRPVHLTLQEALAIDLALRSVSGGRPPAFGDAAPRLRRKLRELLGMQDRRALETFDQSVAGPAPSDKVGDTICLVKEAMSRNIRLRIEYYTASRDAVTERAIEPWGLVDHRGHWYVVAGDQVHEGAVPFRVDRIRDAVLLVDEEYEVPDDFTTLEFRRDEMWRQGPGDLEVRVRFSAAAAPRIREEADRRSLQELPEGEVVRTYRISEGRPRWLYTHIARHGSEAEILSPPDIRAGMALFLRGALSACRRKGPLGGTTRRSSARTAAAVSRPKRAQARRKPRPRQP